MMLSMIGEKTMAGIQKRMDGTYLVKEAMIAILSENDFLYLLNPLPTAASGAGGGKVAGAPAEEPGTLVKDCQEKGSRKEAQG